MNRDFLDPSNYQFIGRLPVQKDKDLIIPDTWILSETLLIRWTILNLVKGSSIYQIQDATLSNWLTIPGLGQFDPVRHQLAPSIQGHERVQLIGIDPTLPLEWRIEGVDRSVLNSTLEFYSTDIMTGNFSNPISVAATDLTPLVAAIQAGTAANVAAIQQATAAENPVAKAVVDKAYTAKTWTNQPNKHIALDVDLNRIGGSIFNGSNGRVAVDRFLDIGTRTPEPQFDGFIEPGGTYNLNLSDAHEGVLLYTIGQNVPDRLLNISVELKNIPPAGA